MGVFMKVYFSTTSSDIERARELMHVLIVHGHEITHDWTAGFEREAEMSDRELTERADADIDAVHRADVVVVYMQPKMEHQMTGAAIEMGAAFALDKPVVVVEDEAEFRHFFQYHPMVTRVASMDWALRFIEELASNR
jgi:nucleoside 2-deoxyribosyltransferase